MHCAVIFAIAQLSCLTRKATRSYTGSENAHFVLFARCRPTHPRRGAARAGNVDVLWPAVAAAGAAVHRQFDD